MYVKQQVVCFAVAVILTFLVCVSSSCFYPIGDSKNGEVPQLQTFGVLLLVVGIINTFITNVGRENDDYIWNPVTPFHWLIWIFRIVILGLSTSVVVSSKSVFVHDFIARHVYHEPACQYALRNQTDLDSSAYTFYKRIRLAEYDPVYNIVTYNEQMKSFVLSALVLCIVEGFARIIDAINRKNEIENGCQKISILLVQVLQIISSICVAFLTASLVLSNDLAACPFYNAENNTLKSLYAVIGLYFAASLTSIYVNMTQYDWKYDNL